MLVLQNIPNTSLIIIDEVEASLHPRSQRRLIHFLLWLARTKEIQVLISTHSQPIIEEVPEEGRIFLSRTDSGVEVQYGVSPNYALNRMDLYDTPDFYLFCEDKRSVEITKELVRHGEIDIREVCVMDIGPENMVKAIGKLGEDERLPIPCLGVLDSDIDVSEVHQQHQVQFRWIDL